MNASSLFLFLLGSGILIRLVVFAHIGYLNNDNHLEVIEYVARTWLPAHADQLNQGYHPPLYYFLGVVFYNLGGVPAVHFLSLLLSVGTLLLIAALLRQLPWIEAWIKSLCLGLAALHPQFLIYGLFISNDALAFFLGVAICYQCRRVQLNTSTANFLLLGFYLGLGLLTKAVFLAFVPSLLLFLGLVGRDAGLPNAQITGRLALSAAVAAIVGCYKYAEQYFLFGDPLLSNLDLADWVQYQKPTWVGISSLLDINLLKLLRHPVLSSQTVHSYPLLMYATFWYAYIPESTFMSNLIQPLNRLGSAIYLFALAPTLLIITGAGEIARSYFCSIVSRSTIEKGLERERASFEGALLLALAFNLLLILTIGWHYDVWSVFQGRLLFPSYFAILLALASGYERLPKTPPWRHLLRSITGVVFMLFVSYFIIELYLARSYPVNPLTTPHIDINPVDMRRR